MIIISDRALRFFGLFFGGSDNIRGLAFWPFIFISSKTQIDDELINHERIHLRQQIEMLVIPFYIWYLIALYRVGYENISFEKEAYFNEKNLSYLKKRRIFEFIRYL
jgi:hypothetical protein